mmetsp:Transcript_22762/g.65467  ORF Transcript_22762/g.65467 Transcript_22762/m.65467 type:complete len:353 (+) Transcript_22762:298-1356(+)
MHIHPSQDDTGGERDRGGSRDVRLRAENDGPAHGPIRNEAAGDREDPIGQPAGCRPGRVQTLEVLAESLTCGQLVHDAGDELLQEIQWQGVRRDAEVVAHRAPDLRCGVADDLIAEERVEGARRLQRDVSGGAHHHGEALGRRIVLGICQRGLDEVARENLRPQRDLRGCASGGSRPASGRRGREGASDELAGPPTSVERFLEQPVVAGLPPHNSRKLPTWQRRGWRDLGHGRLAEADIRVEVSDHLGLLEIVALLVKRHRRPLGAAARHIGRRAGRLRRSGGGLVVRRAGRLPGLRGLLDWGLYHNHLLFLLTHRAAISHEQAPPLLRRRNGVQFHRQEPSPAVSLGLLLG